MKMRPKEFCVSGRVFRIEYVKKSARLDADDLGCADYALGVITLRTHQDGQRIPADSIRETLIHEITHTMFWAAGMGALAIDEDAVSQLSGVLAQMMISLK